MSHSTNGSSCYSSQGDGRFVRRIQIIPEHIGDELGGHSNIQNISATIEEPWGESLEELLRNWKSDAIKVADNHLKAGHLLKFKHRALGFLMILTSSLSFILYSLYQCTDDTYGEVAVTLIGGINVFFNALSSMLDLQDKYKSHFEYETKMRDLIYDIEFTLSRSIEYRPPADQFITEVKERKKLLDTAPELPFKKIL